MEDGSNTANVEDIRGIWVASDDSTVVEKVKQLAPNYFPNVESSMIEWISGGVQGGPKSGKIATRGLNAVSRYNIYNDVDRTQHSSRRLQFFGGASTFFKQFLIFEDVLKHSLNPVALDYLHCHCCSKV